MVEMARAMTLPQLARREKTLRLTLHALLIEADIAIAKGDTRRLGQMVRDSREVLRQGPGELGLRTMREMIDRIDEEAARA